jgi:hypothetical protein
LEAQPAQFERLVSRIRLPDDDSVAGSIIVPLSKN